MLSAPPGSPVAMKPTAPDATLRPPFFIVGCVRSGTTMLRNALRLHPHLACPEETNFFRWGEVPGTDNFSRMLATNPVLQHHRQIDGITEEEFAQMLWQCESRADLYSRYMALYIARNKPGATRWFDKTPQNVYGALLAATTVHKSRFVHIVRNPVNVVASLRIGRVVKVEGLNGAISYWNEATSIIRGLRRAFPGRVFELRYEDFVGDPMPQLQRLLDFLGEPFDASWFASLKTGLIDHVEAGVLREGEMDFVRRQCRAGMRRYHYIEAGAAAEAED
jgi:hypothetical protein